MAISGSTGVFLISASAIPLTYIVNNFQSHLSELTLALVGTAVLTAIVGAVYYFGRKDGKPADPIFYAMAMGCFASVVDLIIALENDGVIEGFMTFYLKSGEAYLKSAYGTVLCYWDGIAHYAMYLMMLSALSWGDNFREIGLYWAGSISHSMIVFMPGNVLGKYGVKWSLMLNVPYMIFPFMAGARFLMERPKLGISSVEAKSSHVSIWRRPIDFLLILFNIAATLIAMLRGFAVLGCKMDLTKDYIEFYEPYLLDSGIYPKIQMLVYLFYFLPFYVVSTYGLLYPGCQWMKDWSLIFAGMAAQAQVTHIGGSYHTRTPYLLRVPQSPDVQLIFWLINGSLLLFPQLLAYRCVYYDQYFSPVEDKPSSKSKKVENDGLVNSALKKKSKRT